MPYGPILTRLVIKAGALIIEVGMKKALPELAKLLDEPELESIAEDLDISNALTETITKFAKS